MFDIAAAQSLLPRELDAIIDRAQQLTDAEWTTPIEWLPGWTVTELLDHVGRAAGQQAESFENLFAGSQEMPEYPHPAGNDRPVILGNLKSGRDRFVDSVNQVTVEHLEQLTPLPFAVVPTPAALQITVLEYAYHRWDLEQALGNSGYDLADDIAPGGFEFLGGLLPMLSAGGKTPDQSLAFELTTPAGSLVLEHSGEAWQPVATSSVASVCTVTGATGTVALFGMGRVRAEDPALSVGGSAAVEAGAFKKYFPGP